jgi:CheY-like chemotaxis protein
MALDCEKEGSMAATILLVDSDLIDRADWQALLQFHGYKVFTAPNGRCALACFHVVNPDLVLVDSDLADFSTEEMCRRLKADPQIGDTPIVIVGSYLSRLKQRESSEENSGDCSTGPATRAQALNRIHDLLASRQFELFNKPSIHAHDRAEHIKVQTPPSSMQFNG